MAFLSLGCIASVVQAFVWGLAAFNHYRKGKGQAAILQILFSRFTVDLVAFASSVAALSFALLGIIIAGARASAIFQPVKIGLLLGAIFVPFQDGPAVGFGAVGIIIGFSLLALSVILWRQTKGGAASASSSSSAVMDGAAALAPMTPSTFENKAFRAAALSTKRDLGGSGSSFAAAPTPTTGGGAAVEAKKEVAAPAAAVAPPPPPQAPPGVKNLPSLPPGWTSARTDEGQEYFVETVTNTSVWERPNLPAGWIETTTEEGATYYVNGLTQATQWETPTDVATE
jgi:WW domain